MYVCVFHDNIVDQRNRKNQDCYYFILRGEIKKREKRRYYNEKRTFKSCSCATGRKSETLQRFCKIVMFPSK